MWIEESGRHLVLLPGPPRELKPMFENAVLPRVRQMGRGRRLAQRTFHITGMTESEVDSKVAAIYQSYPRVQPRFWLRPDILLSGSIVGGRAGGDG